MIDFDSAGFARGPSEILRGVSLSLEAGTMHLVLGGPGAGKSTLIGLAHAGLRPTEGTVRHFGRTIGAGSDAVAAVRRRLGVVERDARFLAHLSLRENVAAPLVASGGDPEARADDVAALLAWTGLATQADAPPAALTAGERQRAAVARAVILDPEVVVADDPAVGLTDAEAEALLGLVVDLARMGRTVLLATQEVDRAGWIAERMRVRAFRLAAGRLEAA